MTKGVTGCEEDASEGSGRCRMSYLDKRTWTAGRAGSLQGTLLLPSSQAFPWDSQAFPWVSHTSQCEQSDPLPLASQKKNLPEQTWPVSPC